MQEKNKGWSTVKEDERYVVTDNNLLKNLNLAWKFIESNELKDSALIDLRITNQLIIQ